MAGDEDTHNHLPDSMGQLAVNCWCEEDIVFVDAEDLKKGWTNACRRPPCKAIGRKVRE